MKFEEGFFVFSTRQGEDVATISTKDSFATWEEVARAFSNKYFPPSKTTKCKNDIMTFAQMDHESLYEAWERFKELLRKCPHHEVPKWLQLQTFYLEFNQTRRR